MKYFKLAVLAFVVCFGIHTFGVKADAYRSFINIKIPKASSYYESIQVSKDIENFQYYYNQTTNGGALGTSNVSVKTSSPTYGVSYGLKVNQGQEKTWGNDPNQFKAQYSVRISSTSIFTGASHWGHWLLDARLAGTI